MTVLLKWSSYNGWRPIAGGVQIDNFASMGQMQLYFQILKLEKIVL